ncbi:TIGR04372 family glycosyltransferase [Ferrovibrio terrae]|uniref:TIGR04372 family glycosyltransferase n=1 Tax=Ferrovibrio terrae TaxID=2594003 RepID=UPI0031384788
MGPLIKALLYACAAVAIVLASRLLRPVLLIRFGNLRNHTIGTLSLHAEGYMADRDLGIIPRNTLDLFFHTEPRANRVLDTLLEQHLHISPLARYCSAINARLPGRAAHVVTLGDAQRDAARNHFRAYTETPQHFMLTPTQIAEARRQMRQHCGIPDDAKFVCFFSRTSSYLRELHKAGSIRRPDEIPTQNIRDSAIETFLPAAEELARRGYWCFRMGAVVDETISAQHNCVIDYASRFRSELLDIYLISHCAMLLSDTTGLCDLSFMFRRPAAIANLFNMGILHSWSGLLMPKKYIVERENRLFTLPELLANGGGPSSPSVWPEYAARHGLRLEDNSPEEILDLAIEMNERLAGKWVENDVDIARRERIAALYEDYPLQLGGPLKSTFSTSYLRRHPGFLG